MGCAHFIPLLLKREAFEKVPDRREKGCAHFIPLLLKHEVFEKVPDRKVMGCAHFFRCFSNAAKTILFWE